MLGDPPGDSGPALAGRNAILHTHPHKNSQRLVAHTPAPHRRASRLMVRACCTASVQHTQHVRTSPCSGRYQRSACPPPGTADRWQKRQCRTHALQQRTESHQAGWVVCSPRHMEMLCNTARGCVLGRCKSGSTLPRTAMPVGLTNKSMAVTSKNQVI